MQPFVINRGMVEGDDVLGDPRTPDIRAVLGYVALGVAVVAGTISGFLFGVKWGFLALSVLALIVAYLLGAE